jgi:Uma2 family endonuclease
MSIITPSTAFASGLAAVPGDLIWRLSVGQYHAMIRTGILTPDHPVELLDGWLVLKMPKNPPHRVATRLTCKALERVMPAGWYVDQQEPITTQNSEPEPDVVVVRGDTREYLDRHPGLGDVPLVVEVSDTTLERDRTLKKRIYAFAEIPTYSIVNLVDQQVEVYTEPSGEAEPADYRQRQDYALEDSVPVVVEGREIAQIAVTELIP